MRNPSWYTRTRGVYIVYRAIALFSYHKVCCFKHAMEKVSGKTKDLRESFSVNQDLLDNKVANLEEEIKKLKKIVYEKDSETQEEIRIQKYRSRQNLRTGI